MEELPTLDFNIGDFSGTGLTIGSGLLQAIFYVSIIITVIFTIILFGHWKKYAPNPLKTFGYSIIYIIGAGAMIVSQVMLLSLY